MNIKQSHKIIECCSAVLLLSLILLFLSSTAWSEQKKLDQDNWSHLKNGAQVYKYACASCHGIDGKGAPAQHLGFLTPVPDFTDCSFTSREPKSDWFAIAHNGGPTRAFAEMMPAFGNAITDKQLGMAVDYIKDFCQNDNWPDGKFNIPRSLITGKAFPEDEIVIELESTTDEPVAVQLKFIAEKRIGERNQVELILPINIKQSENSSDNWEEGFGDLGLAWKGVLWHDFTFGSIGSLGVDFFFPVGDEQDKFSKGVFRLEPFIAIGQLIPGNNFFQLHTGAELSADTQIAKHEIFWRCTLGHKFIQGRFGRVWSPMLEIIGVRELEKGADLEWSIAPQLHLTLSRRQHVMLVIGAEIPVTDYKDRQIKSMVHMLWDWFDGGFSEGW